jgi:hypothetical protein
MKLIGLLALIIALVIPAQAVWQGKVTGDGRLLETGEFHGNEVKARSGEQWLGLYVTGKRSFLRLSTIRIDPVEDPVVDPETDKWTGKRVSISNRTSGPVFLVRGIERLKQGNVTTLYDGLGGYRGEGLKPEDVVTLKLNRADYQLLLKGRQVPVPYSKSETRLHNARLVLKVGKSEQTLYSLKDKPEDAIWTLIWAGDLDQDGKLDLYLDLAWHYNISQRTLFLSSHAEKGKLVKKVAEFVTSGC